MSWESQVVSHKSGLIGQELQKSQVMRHITHELPVTTHKSRMSHTCKSVTNQESQVVSLRPEARSHESQIMNPESRILSLRSKVTSQATSHVLPVTSHKA